MQSDDLGLGEEDMAEIVEYFDAYSMREPPVGTTREDLPVTTDSLELLLGDMGFLLTEAELIRLQEKLDPQQLGYVTVTNFVEHAAGPLFARSRLTEENVEQVFGIFDGDSDGLIREADIKALMSLFGERTSDRLVNEMLVEADMDGDRAISMDEFKYFATGEVF